MTRSERVAAGLDADGRGDWRARLQALAEHATDRESSEIGPAEHQGPFPSNRDSDHLSPRTPPAVRGVHDPAPPLRDQQGAAGDQSRPAASAEGRAHVQGDRPSGEFTPPWTGRSTGGVPWTEALAGILRLGGRRGGATMVVRRARTGRLAFVTTRGAYRMLKDGRATGAAFDAPGICHLLGIDAETADLLCLEVPGIEHRGVRVVCLEAPVALAGGNAHIENASYLGDVLSDLGDAAALRPELAPLGDHGMVAARTVMMWPRRFALAIIEALRRGEDPIGDPVKLDHLATARACPDPIGDPVKLDHLATARACPWWKQMARRRTALACEAGRRGDVEGVHRSTAWRRRKLWSELVEHLERVAGMLSRHGLEVGLRPTHQCISEAPKPTKLHRNQAIGWHRWATGIDRMQLWLIAGRSPPARPPPEPEPPPSPPPTEQPTEAERDQVRQLMLDWRNGSHAAGPDRRRAGVTTVTQVRQPQGFRPL